MTVRTRFADVFAAQDPGHARLTVAAAVSVGMLVSAAFGQFIVHAFHAQAGLLAMSIFLSVQAGSMVKDASASARVVTTALLIPALGAAIVIATMLSAHRVLVIGGFILVTGAAIWVRRYGPRAGAFGSLFFMGYFFTLFMKPTVAELPAFLLVAGGAVAAQLLMRALLLLKRPRRELEVMLRELRAGSAAAVRVSRHTTVAQRGHRSERTLRMALARLDSVGRAITTWQHSFRTEKHIAVDEQSLAEHVLDARVDIEEACYERARQEAASDGSTDRAERALLVVLDERASPDRIHAAQRVAEELLESENARITQVEGYLLARSAVSHAQLRDIDLAHGLDAQRDASGPPAHALIKDAPRPVPATHARATRPAAVPRGKSSSHWNWRPWRSWAPTSRMAVQAMIAALIATGAGEAISASRWYWAVMTAFVIFIGATTRSSILTRAYRRVAGTGIGITVGVAAVALAGTNTPALVAISVVAVFGMLYFGPMNYLYSAVFITVMLVALYRMLGVLDGSILELRLVETLTGAVIGVLSAYLIVSANSSSVLLTKVNAYFDALDELLHAVSDSQQASEAELMGCLHTLESAQADLDQAISSMSTAFLIGNAGSPHRESDAVHAMFVASRGAARLVQAVLLTRSRESSAASTSTDALHSAVDDVLRAAQRARAALSGAKAIDAERSPAEESGDQGDDAGPPSLVVDKLQDVPPGDTAMRDAILALARIDWSLQRIFGSTGPSAARRAKPLPV